MSAYIGLNNHIFMTGAEVEKFKRHLRVGNRTGVFVGGKLVMVLLSAGEYRKLAESELSGVGETEVKITESGTEARGEHGGAIGQAVRRAERASDGAGEAGSGGLAESGEGEA